MTGEHPPLPQALMQWLHWLAQYRLAHPRSAPVLDIAKLWKQLG